MSTVVQRVSKPAASPAYVTIAAELRDRIEVDRLAPGALLPSERELSEQYSVSRMTARHAVSLLENEGVVERRPPRGTFVAKPRFVFRIGSFSDEVTRAGHIPSAKVLWAEAKDASPAVREAFAEHAIRKVHALRRVRFADDEPVAIETTYFPMRLTPGILDQDLDGSLWALLRDKFDIEPTRSRASLRSIVIDDASCALLKIRSASAGILLTRWTYDQDGRCIEFARDVYRADVSSFELAVEIPPPL